MTLDAEMLCNTQENTTYCEEISEHRSLWDSIDVPRLQDVLGVIHGWLGDPFYDAWLWLFRGIGIVLVLLIVQYQFKRVRNRWFPKAKRQDARKPAVIIYDHNDPAGPDEETAERNYGLA